MHSSDTHIAEAERKVLSLTSLNLSFLMPVIVDDVEIGNLLVPIVQVADAIVIV